MCLEVVGNHHIRLVKFLRRDLWLKCGDCPLITDHGEVTTEYDVASLITEGTWMDDCGADREGGYVLQG